MKIKWILVTLLSLWVLACSQIEVNHQYSIVRLDSGYQLQKDGEAYDLKGAGLSYDQGSNFAALAQAGGNTIRTWSTHNADALLEQAKQHNLMVLMGIDVQKQLHGFDYNDEQAVAAQFARVKQQVLAYQNHPQILGWIVANEPNLLFDEQGGLAEVNPKVYMAISDIIDFIHEHDPNKLVTYSFAGAIESHIKTALKYTPQVDFVSVQVYGDLANIGPTMAAMELGKPFMVTEFGPLGHWEMPATSWGREIEEPSGIKAQTLAKRIQTGITDDSSGNNIGHFAFLWGQKQERTPTWYGMFNADGQANARVDTMTHYWTGQYPQNRAPQTLSIKINNQAAQASLKVQPEQALTVEVLVKEPDNDGLDLLWELLDEVVEKSDGGAFEQRPNNMPLAPTSIKVASINHPLWGQVQQINMQFTAPATAGEYRLFSYASDGKGKVGNANFPFKVN
ncbi:glycoside hydrolase family 2 TIM barrel-domain containing protein [Paraferrimonas sp. SM1919]|uniref:glycoside hydrolase family 2 TIM barrel-domain containing protein n=1 Tax=Paraferrimonas sp. SM1919 TaxID=2662263 RepID=UPI0013D37987|nr:glycoside hydrolase family 2 TIM barrel-domain containing protein [Paraferrimonas sp. SM1919]